LTPDAPPTIVVDVLGPNGAGKTTLLRSIAGLIEPSRRTVRVFGERVRRSPARYRRLGFMPEHESVYDFLTARQFVELAARLPAVESVERAVRTAIETVGLVDAQNRRLRGYSRRMRLAATLERDGGNFDPGRRRG
jgi:ABC-2 type transport system ATP-binding protein